MTNVVVFSTATVVPCFRATKGGSPSGDQTGVVSGTPTKITFGTEDFDIGGYFASSAWTPPSGKVVISASFYASGTIAANSVSAIYIYKNGANLAQTNQQAWSGATTGHITAEDIANGTDAYTAYAYVTTTSGTATINGGTTLTSFCGHWISA